MRTRRHVLSTTLALVSAFGGCAGLGLGQNPRISATASLLDQGTSDHPPKVQLRMTNQTSNVITVTSDGFPPLVYFPRLTGPTGSVVLLPGNSDQIGADVVRSRSEGCWRFLNSDGERPDIWVRPDFETMDLYPGVTHTVNHLLYYDGPHDTCFPTGTYTGDQEIEFENAGAPILLNYALEVSDGEISSITVEYSYV